MQLRRGVDRLMGQAYAELAELVAIRSVVHPRQLPPRECAQAAAWVLGKFAEVGFDDLRMTPCADGTRAVVGARTGPDPAGPTVLLYTHCDVRPAADEQAWQTPPFELTEVDGRWYGRGAAYCKGAIVRHLTALRALGDDVPVDLRLVVAGGHGVGGLADFLPKHVGPLRADAILVCHAGAITVGRSALTVWPSAPANKPDSGVHARAACGSALAALAAALRDADSRRLTTAQPGGGIALGDLCTAAQPTAEVILMGVAESLARGPGPNENVDPGNIAATALTEATFLRRYAGAW
jgi:acetylornithine deacetylase/succinyl-diaminopimelate desuccinylase-like protein